jgi:hypothetical protein
MHFKYEYIHYYNRFLYIFLGSVGGRPVNAKELDNLLKAKAEKKDTEFLWNVKASKEDLKDNQEAIALLRDQLDHALILIIESIKNTIIWHSDSKHSIVNRNASVLQQLNTVYKWIKSDYLRDSSIIDNFDQISLFNVHTNKTVLPEAAIKLFGRRASQKSRAHNKTTLTSIKRVVILWLICSHRRMQQEENAFSQVSCRNQEQI